MCDSVSPGSPVPSRVQAYVEAIIHTCADGGRALVSVVLFGSAAIGHWVETVSDVDLILVVPDCATDEEIDRLCAAIFPLYPAITKYAMGVLKGSVHNCFFCYELRPASLEEEISFFERRLGSSRTLIQLLALRREYRNSFPFVVCCILTLVRLHWRTSIDNRFPREAHRPASLAVVL